jgi:hypothetical protein
MATADLLQTILDTKADIRDALQEQGMDADIPFTKYADFIKGVPITSKDVVATSNLEETLQVVLSTKEDIRDVLRDKGMANDIPFTGYADFIRSLNAAPVTPPPPPSYFVTVEIFSADGVTPMSTGKIIPKFTVSGTMEYSNDGSTWNTVTSGQGCPCNAQGKVYLRGKFAGNTLYKGSAKADNAWAIEGGKWKISGNLNSLLDYENPPTQLEKWGFASMFMSVQSLIDASGLILPATTLGQYSYFNLFNGCTYLTKAPEFPPATLGTQSYSQMFVSCRELKEVAIASTDTTATSYNGIFNNMATTGTLYAGNTSQPPTPTGWTRKTWAERPQ